MRVLVIDDDPEIRRVLTELLETQGHEVRPAANGETALAHAADVELVICDLNLGYENGIDLIARLRATRPELKVVVLTAEPSIDLLQRASDLGVLKFVSKAEGFEELLAFIDRAAGFDFGSGSVLLFPASLREQIAEIVPRLGEVTTADGTNWTMVRRQIRAAAVACVLVDGTAPSACEFLRACHQELEGLPVFMLFRERDFPAARDIVGRLPGVKCVAISDSPHGLLRRLRDELATGRAESERLRTVLSRALDPCRHAAPLRTGYYCRLSGACPYGEEKTFLVSAHGTDAYRCPRRPLAIRNVDRVALLTWREAPDGKSVGEHQRQISDEVRRGKTHLIVDAQDLTTLAASVITVLAQADADLAHRPDGRIDVVNLRPQLLSAFRHVEQRLSRVHGYARVIAEVGGQSSSVVASD